MHKVTVAQLMSFIILLFHIIRLMNKSFGPFNRERKSNWKNLWLKLRSKKRRCHVPIVH